MAENPTQTPAPLAEISHGPSHFEAFLDRNQKSLLILLVLVILGIAAFVVFRGIQDGTLVTAGNALYAAKDTASLQKTISEYPKTPASATARILLAEKQWSDGQQEASVDTLKSFLSETTKHPGTPSARAALATKLMHLGKASEAAALFEEVIDDPASAFLAPFALLSLGDMASSASDMEKAKRFYERARSDFPASGYNSRITQRIAALDATLPVEIDTPPAPEPQPDATNPGFPVPFAPEAQPPGETPVFPQLDTKAPLEIPFESKKSDSSDDQP